MNFQQFSLILTTVTLLLAQFHSINGGILNILLTNKLEDGPSLSQKLNNWTPESSVTNYTNNEALDTIDELCKNSVEEAEILTEAILTTVNYYESHVDQIQTYDAAIGLKVLEGALQHIFKRRGQNIHIDLINRTIPLIEQIIEQSLKATEDPADIEVLRTISQENSLFSRYFSKWKSPSDLHMRQSIHENLGKDKETIWSTLDRQCLAALVRDCEVPYSCERTYLNPEPQSQYMLTHQTLYLLFAHHKSCVFKHPQTFEGWEHRLESQCGKMLKEAEFVAYHGYADQDLFSEYVLMCGLAGYPNFLRNEWIHKILSWQSNSDYGCFLNERMNTAEIGITRKQTPAELEKNIKPEETCLVHHTATALGALAVKLEFLHDKCLPFGVEYNIMMEEQVAIKGSL